MLSHKAGNLVTQIMALVKKDQDAQMFRATCVDTFPADFTVQIRRIGEVLPDEAHYRYIGTSPSIGDDVIVFRVSGSFYVGAVGA